MPKPLPSTTQHTHHHPPPPNQPPKIYPVAPRRETAGATSKIIGSWLRSNGPSRPRDSLVLASKVAGRSSGLEWIPANRTSPPGEDRSPVLDGPSVIAACEGELRRLGTDYLDVLYLHWPDRYYAGFGRSQYLEEKEWDYSPFSSLVAAIAQLLEEGKVRGAARTGGRPFSVHACWWRESHADGLCLAANTQPLRSVTGHCRMRRRWEW